MVNLNYDLSNSAIDFLGQGSEKADWDVTYKQSYVYRDQMGK